MESPSATKFPWSTLDVDPTAFGGPYPPHQTMGKTYDYAGPNSVRQIPGDRLADFEPDFHTVMIEAKSKLLDLIPSSPLPSYGLIVSERFRRLLEGFKLPPHRYYPLPMEHRRQPIAGYFWLHLPQPTPEWEATLSITQIEQSILADPALRELDLLPVYRPVRFGYHFLSRPLRQAIEQANLQGIRFGTAKLFRTAR